MKPDNVTEGFQASAARWFVSDAAQTAAAASPFSPQTLPQLVGNECVQHGSSFPSGIVEVQREEPE